MSRPRKERLGRGLGALLGDYLESGPVPEGEIRKVPVDAVVPNPFQPRREFREEELQELVASIEANGLLQPIVVRPVPGSVRRYQLVAGERRLRSIGRLGWTEVPAVVRDVDDQTLLVLALVENIQREELGVLEEAEGYRVLVDDFDLTQEEIARAMGKSRSSVANLLRLLRLPPSVRKLLEEGQLSMGHARALLAVEDPGRASEMGRQAAREGWSVRQMEDRVRQVPGPAQHGPSTARGPTDQKVERPDHPVVRSLEEALQEALGARVQIRRNRDGKGSIQVAFENDGDLERLVPLLTGRDLSTLVD